MLLFFLFASGIALVDSDIVIIDETDFSEDELGSRVLFANAARFIDNKILHTREFTQRNKGDAQ